ncbi:hypothetical protein VTK56DRAFT_7890 [Thermocarpiscus australiensis]
MPSETHAQALRASLSQAGLIPGSALIPDDFTPSTELQVAFGGKKVALGNLFRASECKAAPTVAFAKEEEETTSAAAAEIPDSPTYTLLLVDPDAPTPDEPKFAYWRHWVVSGLKPSAQVAQGETGSLSPAVFSKPALTEYLGPGPKDESRPHRYLFLLFREPEGGLSLSKEDVGGEEFVQRRSFQVADWMKQHGLRLVALNWMLGAGDGWKP